MKPPSKPKKNKDKSKDKFYAALQREPEREIKYNNQFVNISWAYVEASVLYPTNIVKTCQDDLITEHQNLIRLFFKQFPQTLYDIPAARRCLNRYLVKNNNLFKELDFILAFTVAASHNIFQIKSLKEKKDDVALKQKRLKAGQQIKRAFDTCQSLLTYIGDNNRSYDYGNYNEFEQIQYYFGNVQAQLTEIEQNNIQNIGDLKPVMISEADLDARLSSIVSNLEQNILPRLIIIVQLSSDLLADEASANIGSNYESHENKIIIDVARNARSSVVSFVERQKKSVISKLAYKISGIGRINETASYAAAVRFAYNQPLSYIHYLLFLYFSEPISDKKSKNQIGYQPQKFSLRAIFFDTLEHAHLKAEDEQQALLFIFLANITKTLALSPFLIPAEIYDMMMEVNTKAHGLVAKNSNLTPAQFGLVSSLNTILNEKNNLLKTQPGCFNRKAPWKLNYLPSVDILSNYSVAQLKGILLATFLKYRAKNPNEGEANSIKSILSYYFGHLRPENEGGILEIKAELDDPIFMNQLLPRAEAGAELAQKQNLVSAIRCLCTYDLGEIHPSNLKNRFIQNVPEFNSLDFIKIFNNQLPHFDFLALILMQLPKVQLQGILIASIEEYNQLLEQTSRPKISVITILKIFFNQYFGISDLLADNHFLENLERNHHNVQGKFKLALAFDCLFKFTDYWQAHLNAEKLTKKSHLRSFNSDVFKEIVYRAVNRTVPWQQQRQILSLLGAKPSLAHFQKASFQFPENLIAVYPPIEDMPVIAPLQPPPLAVIQPVVLSAFQAAERKIELQEDKDEKREYPEKKSGPPDEFQRREKLEQALRDLKPPFGEKKELPNEDKIEVKYLQAVHVSAKQDKKMPLEQKLERKSSQIDDLLQKAKVRVQKHYRNLTLQIFKIDPEAMPIVVLNVSAPPALSAQLEDAFPKEELMVIQGIDNLEHDMEILKCESILEELLETILNLSAELEDQDESIKFDSVSGKRTEAQQGKNFDEISNQYITEFGALLTSIDHTKLTISRLDQENPPLNHQQIDKKIKEIYNKVSNYQKILNTIKNEIRQLKSFELLSHKPGSQPKPSTAFIYNNAPAKNKESESLDMIFAEELTQLFSEDKQLIFTLIENDPDFSLLYESPIEDNKDSLSDSFMVGDFKERKSEILSYIIPEQPLKDPEKDEEENKREERNLPFDQYNDFILKFSAVSLQFTQIYEYYKNNKKMINGNLNHEFEYFEHEIALIGSQIPLLQESLAKKSENSLHESINEFNKKVDALANALIHIDGLIQCLLRTSKIEVTLNQIPKMFGASSKEAKKRDPKNRIKVIYEKIKLGFDWAKLHCVSDSINNLTLVDIEKKGKADDAKLEKMSGKKNIKKDQLESLLSELIKEIELLEQNIATYDHQSSKTIHPAIKTPQASPFNKRLTQTPQVRLDYLIALFADKGAKLLTQLYKNCYGSNQKHILEILEAKNKDSSYQNLPCKLSQGTFYPLCSNLQVGTHENHLIDFLTEIVLTDQSQGLLTSIAQDIFVEPADSEEKKSLAISSEKALIYLNQMCENNPRQRASFIRNYIKNCFTPPQQKPFTTNDSQYLVRNLLGHLTWCNAYQAITALKFPVSQQTDSKLEGGLNKQQTLAFFKENIIHKNLNLSKIFYELTKNKILWSLLKDSLFNPVLSGITPEISTTWLNDLPNTSHVQALRKILLQAARYVASKGPTYSANEEKNSEENIETLAFLTNALSYYYENESDLSIAATSQINEIITLFIALLGKDDHLLLVKRIVQMWKIEAGFQIDSDLVKMPINKKLVWEYLRTAGIEQTIFNQIIMEEHLAQESNEQLSSLAIISDSKASENAVARFKREGQPSLEEMTMQTIEALPQEIPNLQKTVIRNFHEKLQEIKDYFTYQEINFNKQAGILLTQSGDNLSSQNKTQFLALLQDPYLSIKLSNDYEKNLAAIALSITTIIMQQMHSGDQSEESKIIYCRLINEFLASIEIPTDDEVLLSYFKPWHLAESSKEYIKLKAGLLSDLTGAGLQFSRRLVIEEVMRQIHELETNEGEEPSIALENKKPQNEMESLSRISKAIKSKPYSDLLQRCSIVSELLGYEPKVETLLSHFSLSDCEHNIAQEQSRLQRLAAAKEMLTQITSQSETKNLENKLPSLSLSSLIYEAVVENKEKHADDSEKKSRRISIFQDTKISVLSNNEDDRKSIEDKKNSLSFQIINEEEKSVLIKKRKGILRRQLTQPDDKAFLALLDSKIMKESCSEEDLPKHKRHTSILQDLIAKKHSTQALEFLVGQGLITKLGKKITRKNKKNQSKVIKHTLEAADQKLMVNTIAEIHQQTIIALTIAKEAKAAQAYIKKHNISIEDCPLLTKLELLDFDSKKSNKREDDKEENGNSQSGLKRFAQSAADNLSGRFKKIKKRLRGKADGWQTLEHDLKEKQDFNSKILGEISRENTHPLILDLQMLLIQHNNPGLIETAVFVSQILEINSDSVLDRKKRYTLIKAALQRCLDTIDQPGVADLLICILFHYSHILLAQRAKDSKDKKEESSNPVKLYLHELNLRAEKSLEPSISPQLFCFPGGVLAAASEMAIEANQIFGLNSEEPFIFKMLQIGSELFIAQLTSLLHEHWIATASNIIKKQLGKSHQKSELEKIKMSVLGELSYVAYRKDILSSPLLVNEINHYFSRLYGTGPLSLDKVPDINFLKSVFGLYSDHVVYYRLWRIAIYKMIGMMKLTFKDSHIETWLAQESYHASLGAILLMIIDLYKKKIHSILSKQDKAQNVLVAASPISAAALAQGDSYELKAALNILREIFMGIRIFFQERGKYHEEIAALQRIIWSDLLGSNLTDGICDYIKNIQGGITEPGFLELLELINLLLTGQNIALKLAYEEEQQIGGHRRWAGQKQEIVLRSAFFECSKGIFKYYNMLVIKEEKGQQQVSFLQERNIINKIFSKYLVNLSSYFLNDFIESYPFNDKQDSLNKDFLIFIIKNLNHACFTQALNFAAPVAIVAEEKYFSLKEIDRKGLISDKNRQGIIEFESKKMEEKFEKPPSTHIIEVLRPRLLHVPLGSQLGYFCNYLLQQELEVNITGSVVAYLPTAGQPHSIIHNVTELFELAYLFTQGQLPIKWLQLLPPELNNTIVEIDAKPRKMKLPEGLPYKILSYHLNQAYNAIPCVEEKKSSAKALREFSKNQEQLQASSEASRELSAPSLLEEKKSNELNKQSLKAILLLISKKNSSVDHTSDQPEIIMGFNSLTSKGIVKGRISQLMQNPSLKLYPLLVKNVEQLSAGFCNLFRHDANDFKKSVNLLIYWLDIQLDIRKYNYDKLTNPQQECAYIIVKSVFSSLGWFDENSNIALLEQIKFFWLEAIEVIYRSNYHYLFKFISHYHQKHISKIKNKKADELLFELSPDPDKLIKKRGAGSPELFIEPKIPNKSIEAVIPEAGLQLR